MRRTFGITALMAAAALSATVATAAPITWNFTATTGVTPSCTMSGSGYGNSETCTVSGSSVTATAWANTVGSANTAIETAQLSVYGGGLGVTNRDSSWGGGDSGESGSPEHAIDNNDRYDSVLLSFGSTVALTKLNLGYTDTDSDLTVLAFTGVGAPSLSGATYGALAGWSVIGHYANAGTGDELINAANISSKYWLIGAFNPLVGGNTTAYGLNSGNDHFKLYSVSGEQGGGTTGNVVPEPASLALLGLGLMVAAARLRARS